MLTMDHFCKPIRYSI